MTLRARLGLLSLVPLLGLSVPVFGAQGLTFPPDGQNSRSSVTQAIGPVRVTIDYSSPRVVRAKNDRRGKIWGELVPWGMSDLGFNGCASCPWRAGANENTTFAVTHEVKVQGQTLPAGKYGLHMIPGQEEWTVVFSKDASSWGSFWYDPKDDALRVKTKAGKSEYHEWLTYEFTEREPAKATVALKWEELQVPLTIAVDNPNQEQAMRVFQFNAKRFPNQWPVHVGLMRGYGAMGDKKKALEEAKLALAQAPDEQNRKNLQGLVKQLEEGKDIN